MVVHNPLIDFRLRALRGEKGDWVPKYNYGGFKVNALHWETKFDPPLSTHL